MRERYKFGTLMRIDDMDSGTIFIDYDDEMFIKIYAPDHNHNCLYLATGTTMNRTVEAKVIGRAEDLEAAFLKKLPSYNYIE